MVKSIREAESAVGVADYALTDKQLKGKEFSRSLYVVEDMKEGDIINEQNVKSIRPGYGLHPKFYSQVLGKQINADLEKGTRLSLDDIIL
jgi:pseudaminic acid synthase